MTIVHRSQQLFDSEKQPEIENEGEGSHTKVIWFSESLILKTSRKGGMSLQCVWDFIIIIPKNQYFSQKTYP